MSVRLAVLISIEGLANLGSGVATLDLRDAVLDADENDDRPWT